MQKSKPLLIGYVRSEALPTVNPIDAGKLTHINIAFGHIKDSRLTVSRTRNLDTLSKLREYNPNLKILLSIGGWGAGGFSEAASTSSERQTLASTAVNILKDAQLDGIDLDWEYPCYSAAGIASDPADKHNFTLLVQEVRKALDQQSEQDGRPYLLTIACGADQYFIDGTEMDLVQEFIDWAQLMTYDLRGTWQVLTGHHTNLFTGREDLIRISADRSIQLFNQAGVPKEKIVIGGAFYSRMWKNVPDINNGLYQISTGAGGYGPMFTELAENYIDKNGFTRFWDEEAQAPWLFDGSTFITYDDEQSLQAKWTYAYENGLKGIMFWEYSCDQTGRLLAALHQAGQ